MDTTHTNELLTALESAEPADAPDVADRLAAELSLQLEAAEPDSPTGASS